jgi:hypothetical protein
MQKHVDGQPKKKKKKTKKDTENEEAGVEDIEESDLNDLVLIDPGRRDLLYCMKYTSTAEQKELYRYTSSQRAKETKSREYTKIREKIKPTDVKEAEMLLSTYPLRTLDPHAFSEYLEARAGVRDLLYAHYGDTRGHDETEQPLHRKLKLSSYIRDQQSVALLAKDLRKNFGDAAKLVIGNWSAPHQRYHACKIRGCVDKNRELCRCDLRLG